MKKAKDLKPGDVVLGPSEGTGWVGGPFIVKSIAGPTAMVTITWKNSEPDSQLPGTTELELA
jgi:hypothetical protein